MENADNFLLLLKDDIDYRKIQQGKDVYSNFIKRQEGIRKVFVENYIQHIEDSFLCDFGGKKFAVSKVESIFETLTMCCKLFLSGDISKAMSKLYDCYFEEGNTKLKKRTIEKGGIFYRMRKANNYKRYEETEMFHVPFEKNYLTKNERFSISGFPSLYLGKSIYVCWEEMGRPDFDHANVALYKNLKECEVIDLCFPTNINDSVGSLLTLPLILSSSLIVLHPESDFKPEYIIPQLLMQCLVKYNKDNGNAIDGIKYDSIHIFNKDSFYSCNETGHESLYENYVFPAKKVEEEGQCEKLKEIFSLEYSNSFSRFELGEYELATSPSWEDETKPEYEKSKFYRMEKMLSLETSKK